MKKMYFLGFAAVLMSSISYTEYAVENVVEEVTSVERFNQIIRENKNVVIDFYATWCPPCQKLGSIFEGVAKEFTDITFIKVDTEVLGELTNKYGIRALPTLIVLENGEPVSKIVGLKSEATIKKEIKKALS